MPRSLNGYALTNHFRQLRARWAFTHLEAHLFLELIALCTDAKWPAEFSVKNNTLTAAVGCSEPGLIKARKRLAEAGVLTYVEGQNRRPTSYRFCTPQDLTEFSVSAAEHLTEGLTEFSVSVTNEGKHSTEHLTEGLTEFSPYIKEIEIKKVEEENAARAATSSLSSSSEKSENPKPTARSQKAAARADEVAALELPHPGPEFASLWAEFVVMPKQVKKPVTSLRRLLATLGKYAEGFACIMLGKAIEGNWSGLEFDTTAEAYTKWLAAEAERLRRQPVRTNSATNDDFGLNHEFLAEVAAREQAEQDEHFARWQEHLRQLEANKVDPDALFGYTQSAAEGLAQGRDTPEYRQYLAEQAAEQQQANEQSDDEQPDNPPDLPQDAA